jgi:hypothetical protein
MPKAGSGALRPAPEASGRARARRAHRGAAVGLRGGRDEHHDHAEPDDRRERERAVDDDRRGAGQLHDVHDDQGVDQARQASQGRFRAPFRIEHHVIDVIHDLVDLAVELHVLLVLHNRVEHVDRVSHELHHPDRLSDRGRS